VQDQQDGHKQHHINLQQLTSCSGSFAEQRAQAMRTDANQRGMLNVRRASRWKETRCNGR
jgi:hypothetical protein